MSKNEKASISVLKIVLVCIVLIFAFNIVTRAANVQIKDVTIILSNNYELEVVTTKEKVSDILNENHIVVLPDEVVTPNLDTAISDNQVITISKTTDKVTTAVELAEEDSEVSIDQVLSNYTSIVEKIIVEEVVIPYETVTKDVSNNSSGTTNKVIQKGEDGLKKVTYKVKYQNDVEIEKTKISEEVVKEPVDKIVQVQAKTTSRGTTTVRKTGTTTATSGTYKITAYCACSKCCGKSTGITASGTKATAGRTIAAPSTFAFGTKLEIDGKTYVVEDRGGAITGNKIDIYMDSHAEALKWGVRYMTVNIVE